MIPVKIDQKEFKVKSSFEECNIDEISHVMVSQNLLSSPHNDATNLAKLKTGILLRLSNIPAELFLKLSRQQQISLFNTVRWAFKNKIEAKPFPFFEIDGVKFYLPEDNYANTSSVEMALLNIYYLSFSKKDNPVTDNLYLIAATICRPERKDLKLFRKIIERWTGDRREVFNSVLAEERSKLFKEKAPFGVMIAVLQYWESMNNRFVKRFDDVFNGSDSKPLFRNGEGWLAMLEDVAELGVMGPLEKVYETNAYSLMFFVLNKQKKMERLEEMKESQSHES